MLVSALSVWKPPAACQVEPDVSSERSIERHIAPAELGQMIEHRAADDAAADHRNAGVFVHVF